MNKKEEQRREKSRSAAKKFRRRRKQNEEEKMKIYDQLKFEEDQLKQMINEEKRNFQSKNKALVEDINILRKFSEIMLSKSLIPVEKHVS